MVNDASRLECDKFLCKKSYFVKTDTHEKGCERVPNLIRNIYARFHNGHTLDQVVIYVYGMNISLTNPLTARSHTNCNSW